MCGIAGTVAVELPGSDPGMRDAIRYRGRDSQDQWTDGRHARLYHARLSIIALSDGGQPMHDATGRYTIAYNGEIYNYLELRDSYRRQGARFRTNSDTEVILEGFRLLGPSVFSDLNGMFALAIWDSQERRLFLARDRLGKKPLFWTALGGRFYFASTLDAFRDLPGWTGRLMPSAINLYARLGSFPNEMTVFDQAQALPPASWSVLRVGQTVPTVERFWRPQFADKARVTLAEAEDEYEALLTDAIRLRLRADVPLALTFSGGVDSGTIAAISARKLNRALDCYTIDYHTEESPSQETEVARRAAAHLGLSWRHLQYEYRRNLFADAAYACQAFDQPCNHLAMAYSQRLYEAIKPHATVVLSGNGADELFTGYVGNEQVYRRDRIRALARLVPAGLRARLPRYARSMLERLLPAPVDLARIQTDYLRDGLSGFESDDRAVAAVVRIAEDIESSGVSSHLDLLQFMGVSFFGAEANLRLPDITGLRAQVEVRSPFLDYRMVEFAARLPGAFKVGSARDAGKVKLLPKRVYERFVPRDIAWSAKKGMAMNVKFDFDGDPAFQAMGQQALDGVEAAGLEAGHFRAALAQLTRDFRAGNLLSAAAGTAMAGVMLGLWLARRPVAGEIVA